MKDVGLYNFRDGLICTVGCRITKQLKLVSHVRVVTDDYYNHCIGQHP